MEEQKESIGKIRLVTVLSLIALSVLWALALLSYNPQDQSFNTSSGVATPTTANWIGTFGSYSADLLLQGLGYLAYFVPPLILLSCFFILRQVKIRSLIAPIGGTLIMMFAMGNLIALSSYNDETLSYRPGGFLASLCTDFLLPRTGVAGTVIIMAILVAIGLVVGFGYYAEKFGVAIFVRLISFFKKFFKKIFEERPKAHSFIDDDIEDEAPDTPKISHSGAAELPETVEAAWEINSVDDNIADDSIKVLLPEISEPEPEQVQAELETEPQVLSAAETPATVNAEEPPENPYLLTANSEAETISESAVSEPRQSLLPVANPDSSDYIGAVAGNDLYAVDDEDDTDDNYAFEDDGSEAPLTPVAPIISSKNNIAPVPAATLPGHVSASAEEPPIIELQNGKNSQEIAQATKVIDKETIHEQKVNKVEFQKPPVEFLDYKDQDKVEIDKNELQEKGKRLIETLESFGIKGVIREIRVGPVVTLYEFVPAPGIKISKISGLANDIAMSMNAMRVRIVAPIPGKGAVGIEIPNAHREIVYLKGIITSEQFQKSKSVLTMALGKDIEGIPYVADLQKMPHLLIAGATGTGKSVGINAMLTSILYKATPEDVRMIMVDPKQLELSIYEGIPHLLLPVVCDPKKAALALHWAVEEMERRYGMMAELGVRNLAGYNEKIKQLGPEDLISKDGQEFVHLPYIVILIDEFADLMMVASKEIETFVARLAQKARAAGLHLILATQRPSVDVITGTIKANFPSRISFQVSSGHDAKTILDTVGSEHLLGMGDMLYMSAGGFGLTRVHGALVTEKEIEKVVSFLKAQGEPQYDESILAEPPEEGGEEGGGSFSPNERPLDEMYDKAIAFVAEKQKVSISLLQRYLGIGYNRSARIVEQMEKDGIIGPANGAKPREVLVPPPPEGGY